MLEKNPSDKKGTIEEHLGICNLSDAQKSCRGYEIMAHLSRHICIQSPPGQHIILSAFGLMFQRVSEKGVLGVESPDMHLRKKGRCRGHNFL